MASETDRNGEAEYARTRILEAASKLLALGGIAALTTRAVASAASVQAPTLYRLFGEKRGLLNAVAEHVWTEFVVQKVTAVPDADPVRDLSDAWDNYVAFGLANPAVFSIINELGAATIASPAQLAGISILRERVERIAREGRLVVPVDRAVALIHAAGVGTVATLLSLPPETRDEQLSPSARDAVLAAILTDAPVRHAAAGIAPLAVALGSRLGETVGLTPGERLLLSELLGRLSLPDAEPPVASRVLP